MQCPRCGAPAPDEASVCPACGNATRTALGDATGPVVRAPADTTRFLPGMVVAGRYRVVAPLGRGGMGEVYRADDLKLGEAVALKFLPEPLALDPQRRARLLSEVKLARSVTHPNVCRVHDVGEVEGALFLSMEYLDGEDLASLLRRVGRLPQERAVQVAREICVGLAAAHERGILHRDLKPANVMIDGRGHARLTDFGLAAVATSVGENDIRSGTPAYMAPEQLAGREVSAKSDLYALGLVLYELFTGRTAWAATTPEGLITTRRSGPPTRPSAHIRDLAPEIEDVILQCLEGEPAARPRSAAVVSARLPGGDPLAAALAAGETPSPEIVAAAGGAGTLSTPIAAGILVLLAAGLVASAVLSDRSDAVLRDGLVKPPDVLVDRAAEILRAAGAAEHSKADRTWGFTREGRKAGFWYREGPHPIVVTDAVRTLASFDNPPFVRGSAGVRLEGDGRLTELRVMVTAADAQPSGGTSYDALLAAARLDEVRPGRPDSDPPPVYGNARRAWDATRDGEPVHVEAAALGGGPVFFRVGPAPVTRAPVGWGTFYAMLGALIAVIMLARRNLRTGRGDPRGALVFSAVAATLGGLGFGFLPARPAALLMPALVVELVGRTLFYGFASGLAYLGLEPFVRRHWPETLTTWARVVAGSWRDPRLGRDVLIGIATGTWLAVLDLAIGLLPGRQPTTAVEQLSVLLGGRFVLAEVLRSLGVSAVQGVVFLLLLVAARAVLRRPALALLSVSLLIALPDARPLSGLPLLLLFVTGTFALLLRCGLVAGILGLAVHLVLAHGVFTVRLDAWYADLTWFAGGLLLAAGIAAALSATRIRGAS